jgi:MFS transporter, PAT family, beta-lactamase induction signal transducer AmpG
MLSAEPAPTHAESSGIHERPWLFGLLIAPDAVISLGLVGGALTFLLRNEGVDPARAASISSLIALPHAIYFLWGLITDFRFQRRTWLLIAGIVTAAIVVYTFHLPRLGSPLAVGLLFVAASIAVLSPAACGGIMATLHREIDRRRASSFYQVGSLAVGAIAVFAIASLADRVSLFILGLIVAAMILLPALAAFAAPSQPVAGGRTLRETTSLILRECKSTFLRWEAIPYTLTIAGPAGSGGMIGLLGSIARDYGVTAQQVAWINGILGALLTAAGALAASLIPVRVRAPVAFLLASLINAATLCILALGPLHPAVYFTGTILYLFTVGACYAFTTAVILEFLGASGKSGSGRYSIINSLANVPVAYMIWLDGRGYTLWGSRGEPGMDAAVSGVYVLPLLLYFVFAGRRQPGAAA